MIVEIGGRYTGVVPLERTAVAHPLSGAQGTNRAPAFPYIAAHNDLEAIRAYLHQPKTLRAYTKELERFLLRCVCERRKALSDLLVDDCEAYKDFIKAPSPAFVGPRFARTSPRWRPFADGTLLPESPRYAVRALRAAFTWEAAGARREKLSEMAIRSANGESLPVWELPLSGKRNAERTVPVSPETIKALRAHWADRKDGLGTANASGPLLSPVIIPKTSRALAKHTSNETQPYSVKAINELVR